MVKKVFGAVFLAVLLMTFTSAAALVIEKQQEVPILIADSEESAQFKISVKNTGQSDTFEIYSFVGVKFSPTQGFVIANGESKDIDVTATFSRSIRNNIRGFFLFEYELYSPRNLQTKDKLLVKIVDLESLFDIESPRLLPGEDTVTIKITNKEDREVNDVKFSFDSQFFEGTETLSFTPLQSREITLPVNTESIRNELAGTYPVELNIDYLSADTTNDIDLAYLEKNGLVVSEEKSGWIIRKTVIEKRNEGNIPITAIVSTKRDILTRLVTGFSINPIESSQSGLTMSYEWREDLQPGESLRVETTTNYTLPFILIALVLIVIVCVRFFIMRTLVITKNVNPVKTRGGEFALKITLTVRARKNLENVILTDHIPYAMKVYERFTIKPEKIDESMRTISWKLNSLHAGESRVFSYIVYSKMKVVGSSELPLAHASFTVNGKRKHMSSNKTAFLSDAI